MQERAKEEHQHQAKAAELRKLKTCNNLLREQVQQQEQQLQQHQQNLGLLQQRAEKEVQQQREKQQEHEQQMMQAVEQLNAAVSHKEARIKSLQEETEAGKLQLER